MITYEKYKESGIQWIGEIPEDWVIKKFKLVTTLLTCGHAATPNYVDEADGIPFLSAQNIKNERISLHEFRHIEKTLHELLSRNHKVEKGDLLQVRVGGSSTIGQTAIVDLDFDFSVYVSLSHIKLDKSQAYNAFIKFMCNSDRFKECCSVEMKKGAGVANLNVADLEVVRIPVPPLSEQTAIANYLYSKTTEIDQVVADKEALISLYEEEKKALINEAVTKGVALSGVETSDAKFKPSGVDWLGDVPERWEVKKLKYLAKICNGREYREIQIEEGGYPVYGTGGIFNRCSDFIYDKTSVLLGRKGTVDRPIFVEEPFWTSDTIYYTEIDKTVAPKFFYFLCLQIQFDLYIYGSAVPSMTKEYYDHIYFPLPPLTEQAAIVQYIESETANINDKINQIKQEIALLKEYRQALIFEAVTGKVRID